MKPKLISSIIFLICISLFLFLGFWQLDRATEKENIVKLYEERQLIRAEKLNKFSDTSIESKYYKNFKIKGTYINKTFLVDNKIKNNKPGFNVLSLFRLSASNEIIVVDRGWLEMKGQRKNIEENFQFLNNQEIEKSVQEIDGYIYPRDKSYTIGDISINKSWPRLIQAVNFEEIKDSIKPSDLLISGVVFRLNSNNSFGFDRSWEIISMGSNKHLGYAFQWFSMAFALIILTILFFVRKRDGKNG